jgi:hypothetical protein
VRESAAGFETRFEYWDISLQGWPVVAIEARIARDGRMLAVTRSGEEPPDGEPQ